MGRNVCGVAAAANHIVIQITKRACANYTRSGGFILFIYFLLFVTALDNSAVHMRLSAATSLLFNQIE